jgi:nucleotide-binding universal stress UspA family protein
MHVVVGTPWYEICRYARDAEIDLIVIATHGATGLRHLLMGSTAERVVQHATAPVLAVKSIEREFVDDPMSAAARGEIPTPRPAVVR